MARAALWRWSAIARRAGPSSASSVASAPCASKIAASSARPRSTRSSRAAARSSRTWASASSSRAASAAGSSASPSGTAGAPPIRRKGPSAKPGEAGMPCRSVSAAGASAGAPAGPSLCDGPANGREASTSKPSPKPVSASARTSSTTASASGPDACTFRVWPPRTPSSAISVRLRAVGGAAARRRVGEQERRVVAGRELDELRGGPRVQPEPVADRELGLRVHVPGFDLSGGLRLLPEFGLLGAQRPHGLRGDLVERPAATGVDAMPRPPPRRAARRRAAPLAGSSSPSSSTICAVCTAEPRSMRTRTPSSPDASRARSTAAPISSKSVPIPSSTPPAGSRCALSPPMAFAKSITLAASAALCETTTIATTRYSP